MNSCASAEEVLHAITCAKQKYNQRRFKIERDPEDADTRKYTFTFEVPKLKAVQKENGSCCLCNKCISGEKKGCQLECSHSFHTDCVSGYLQSDELCCPICRRKSVELTVLDFTLRKKDGVYFL